MAGRIRSNNMLTTGYVAHLLNVHVNTVRRWSTQGILEAYRIGPRGDRRFRRVDIARFLAKLSANRGGDRQIGSTPR